MFRQPPPEIIAAARESAAQWGVPASVSLGQWALESGWGEHEPPGSNNPFGIKQSAGQAGVESSTTEFVSGAARQLEQAFAVFPDVAAAFDAHARLLANPEGPYAASGAMLPIAPGDRAALSRYVATMSTRYATDPHYSGNLWALMIGNSLVDYDAEGPSV
jgi:flagellum-specific peptidoglycan hydrolase FlgJ